MSDNLVKKLRLWGDVWPEDMDKPEGHLYEEAADRIEELETNLSKCEALLAKAVVALDEAIYLLATTEKDMERQAGVYRIVTTLAAVAERHKLTGQDDE